MLQGASPGEVDVKSHDRAVVIGGGVVGASVLYHLTKLGWSDVALIDVNSLPTATPISLPIVTPLGVLDWAYPRSA